MEPGKAKVFIRNPILKGFNPDPSIVRVGDDYYIATSSFEWFPGIPIYHSRDLANWRRVGHALTRKTQLDLAGIQDSGGVWAPSLSFSDGLFYMVYSVVRTSNSPFKDVNNYLVTSRNITGPWSEPTYLNSSGFDPSLFHDDDGRKWLLNIQWDYRPGNMSFAGIVLQEFDQGKRRLVGEPKNIMRKDVLIEGPNLYKRHGYYYLMLAEGGTSWNHAISMSRSKSIAGPYEADPLPVFLTSRQRPELPLQKSGHGEIVETPSGETYLVHLCSRPVMPERKCILGRETAIQRCRWTEDGWLRLESGNTDPELEVEIPAGHTICHREEEERDDFNSEVLSNDWCTLRSPADESWLNLEERPGWLRLRGRESMHSLFEQSLAAKRMTSLKCTAETCIDFHPIDFMQSAGLVCWYNTQKHYYLRISRNDDGSRTICVACSDNGKYSEIAYVDLSEQIPDPIRLRARIDHGKLQFSFALSGKSWTEIGPVLDSTILSDDHGPRINFTGTLIGICAQDLKRREATADFDYFEIRDEN